MLLVHLFLVFLAFHALCHARVYSLHYYVVQGVAWPLEVMDVVEMIELMDLMKVIEVTEVAEVTEVVEMVEDDQPMVVKAEEVPEVVALVY